MVKLNALQWSRIKKKNTLSPFRKPQNDHRIKKYLIEELKLCKFILNNGKSTIKELQCYKTRKALQYKVELSTSYL
jgi:hypothetical protein